MLSFEAVTVSSRLRPTALGGWLAGLVGLSFVLSLLAPGAFGLVSGLCGVLLPTAALFAWRNLRGLEVGVARRLTCTAGARTPLELVLRSTRGHPARDVRLAFEPAGGLNPALIAHVERLERREARPLPARLRWAWRGRRASLELSLHSTFPAGLFEVRRVVRLEVEHLVQPQVLRARELSRAVDAALGEAEPAARAQAVGAELYGLAPWRPGDSSSRVAWKLLARYPDPLVRRYHAMDQPRLRLTFDPHYRTGQSRGARETFEFGVQLFASLAAALLAREARLSVDLGDGSGPRRLTRGRAELRGLLARLADVAPLEPGAPAAQVGGLARGERSVRVHFKRPLAGDGAGKEFEIDAAHRASRRLLPRVAGSLGTHEVGT